MPVNYPASLDSFVDPLATDDLETIDHAAQHVDKNGAVEALEAKVGITASTPTSGKVLTGGATAGTSTWETPAASGGFPNPDGLTYGGFSWFCIPGLTPTGSQLRASAIDRTNYCPIVVEASRTFDRIAVQVTTAVAGTARLGIYAVTAAMAPAALVLDAGTVNTGTPGIKAITINQTLSAGVYYLVAHTTSACTLAALLGIPIGMGMWEDYLDYANALSVTQTIAALPTPGTAISAVTESATSFENFVWLRPS